jgi:hypothetical protein
MVTFSREDALALKDDFREHWRSTMTPESFPNLDWSKPELTTHFELVGRFAIARKQRPANSDDIPCALCSGRHPKFLEGSLFWFEDGKLRLIGHKCARRHFGEERMDLAVSAYDAKLLLDAEEGYLRMALPLLATFHDELVSLTNAAKLIERAQDSLSKSAPMLARSLRSVLKQTRGMLVVSAGNMKSAPDSKGAPQDIHFGQIDGSRFLSPSFRPACRLAKLKEGLSALNLGDGADALGEFVRFGTGTPHFAKRLRRIAKEAVELRDDLAESYRFLQGANLTRIRDWLRDPRSPGRGEIVLDPLRARVRDDQHAWGYLPIDYNPTLLAGVGAAQKLLVYEP